MHCRVQIAYYSCSASGLNFRGFMGRLTTHVLDTARGRPGAGVQVKLFSLERGRHLVASAVTNADGRTDAPLLDAGTFREGSYEIEFAVGRYFADSGLEQGQPPFLGDVVVRCALQAGQNYHVPLLVSPWSYSTYRGS
jgi:hydroxyisourate hydrolase